MPVSVNTNTDVHVVRVHPPYYNGYLHIYRSDFCYLICCCQMCLDFHYCADSKLGTCFLWKIMPAVYEY